MTKIIKNIGENKFEITDKSRNESKVIDSLVLENTLIYEKKEYENLGQIIAEHEALLKSFKDIK
jgi:hypothetical protein